MPPNNTTDERGDKAVAERTDHGRVPDKLERHEPNRAVEVVLGHGVVVALDRGEHQVLDRPDVREEPGDLVRRGRGRR